MQALAILDLRENELVGPIPPVLGNLSFPGRLLVSFHPIMKPPVSDCFMLTGPMPPEIGDMSKLSYLQLTGNKLAGKIPEELGKLEHLFELNLVNDYLEGSIPHT